VFSFFPPQVLFLGMVSFFMGMSSVTTMILSPIFVTEILHASTKTAGFIEGTVESLSSFIKVFSGALSDKIQKRKIFMFFGYGSSALTKILFAVASTVPWLFAGRILDRLSNGLRDTPRDALISEAVSKENRAACFSLRSAMATFGSFLGSVMVMIYAWKLGIKTASDFSNLFILSMIPACVAVFIVWKFVRDIKTKQSEKGKEKASRKLSANYILFLVLIFIFYTGKFGEGMLMLRVNQILGNEGIDLSGRIISICTIMIAMNALYSSVSYPMGKLADKYGKVFLCIFGTFTLMITNVILAFSSSHFHLIIGVLFWGIYMGMTQGVMSAIVVDLSSDNNRGWAFGWFHFISGLGAFVGNNVGGTIWHNFSSFWTFAFGAICSTICFLGFITIRKRISYEQKN
jgi:MFS family permease